MDVARARGVAARGGRRFARGGRARKYAPAVRQLDSLLKAVDSLALDSVDRRALRTMRRTAATELNADSATAAAPDTAPPDCRYDPAAIAALPNGLDSLSTRMYACYGYAAQHVTYGAEHLDRLTILGRLTGTDSAAERERLFRALAPVFRSMNGDDGPASPYRAMVRLSAAALEGARLAGGRGGAARGRGSRSSWRAGSCRSSSGGAR